MAGRVLNVGFDNAVLAERVVAVVSADPSPIKRLREAALRHGKLIDATNGRRTRTVIVTDSDHVVLSSVQTETMVQRLTDLARTPSEEPVSSSAARPSGSSGRRA